MRLLPILLIAAGLSPAMGDEAQRCPDVYTTLFSERDRLYLQRFADQEKAVEEARKAADDHFVTVQNFLNAAIKQTENYVPRSENNIRWNSLDSKIADLETRQIAAGKSLDDKISLINQSLTSISGRSEGSNSLWIIILGAGMFILTSANVVIMLRPRSVAKG